MQVETSRRDALTFPIFIHFIVGTYIHTWVCTYVHRSKILFKNTSNVVNFLRGQMLDFVFFICTLSTGGLYYTHITVIWALTVGSLSLFVSGEFSDMVYNVLSQNLSLVIETR
jgi:hypothetical protein